MTASYARPRNTRRPPQPARDREYPLRVVGCRRTCPLSSSALPRWSLDSSHSAFGQLQSPGCFRLERFHPDWNRRHRCRNRAIAFGGWTAKVRGYHATQVPHAAGKFIAEADETQRSPRKTDPGPCERRKHGGCKFGFYKHGRRKTIFSDLLTRRFAADREDFPAGCLCWCGLWPSNQADTEFHGVRTELHGKRSCQHYEFWPDASQELPTWCRFSAKLRPNSVSA
jgi:hypothetical protein